MGLWHLKTISKQLFEADASEADDGEAYDDSESTQGCQHDRFEERSMHVSSNKWLL